MKGTVPTWLERWLGLPQVEVGEGTTWRLDYYWPWSPAVTLMVLAAAAALIIFCYLREAGAARRNIRIALIVVRLAVVAMLCGMLAQFTLSLERTGLPYLVFVVDDSSSMGIADRYDEPQLRSLAEQYARGAGFDKATRLNLAKSLLLADDGELLRDAARRHKVRLYFLSDAARAAEGELPALLDDVRNLAASGASTRLGQGIRSILNDLRGAPPAAIVLFSDGINTNGESLAEAATFARRKGVPLCTVALGNDRPSRDLAVSDLLVDDIVFVDDVVNFEFKLTGHGFSQQQVDLVLREEGIPAPLAKTTVTVGPDGEAQKVRITYRPTAVGEFNYVVEAATLPDELRTDNNREARLINVRQDQIRVLLVQSYPNYEFRYLKHLFERDSTVELQTILQESDPAFAEIDQSALRAFPVQREDLFKYDVIVFGDVNPSLLGPAAMRNLHDFVAEKGGGVVFIAGQRFTPAAYRDTPLAALFPLDFVGASAGQPIVGHQEGFQVVPTEMGLASPTMQLGDSLEETTEIWSNLPSLYWRFEIARLKPAVRVLAENPGQTGTTGQSLPLVCLQYVGAGKVLFHAVDSTWRWRYRVGDVYFARYWVQTIRYLSRGKLAGKDRTAELTTDRREYQRGEPVKLRVRFGDERLAPVEDDGVSVVVEQQGANNQRVQLRRITSSRGAFEATLGDLTDGRFHAWLAAPQSSGPPPTCDFAVAPASGELDQTQADFAALERASAETKGPHFTLATAGQLNQSFPGGRQVPIESLPPIELWNRWPMILLFLSLLIGEWLLRKRYGMI